MNDINGDIDILVLKRLVVNYSYIPFKTAASSLRRPAPKSSRINIGSLPINSLYSWGNIGINMGRGLL